MSPGRAIICIILPPIAVIDRGFSRFLIVLPLTLAFWVPGVIAAFVINSHTANKVQMYQSSPVREAKSSPVREAKSRPWKVIDIVEVNRSEERIGTDERLVDNSKSKSTLHRSLTLARKWTQTYFVEEVRTRGKKAEGNLGIKLGIVDIAGIKLAAEDAVASKYSTTNQTRRSFSEEIELDIPPQSKVRLSLHWKCIWQQGFVRLCDDKGKKIEVPFRIAIGLTFDQEQVDED